jgi:hypothetical protein
MELRIPSTLPVTARKLLLRGPGRVGPGRGAGTGGERVCHPIFSAPFFLSTLPFFQTALQFSQTGNVQPARIPEGSGQIPRNPAKILRLTAQTGHNAWHLFLFQVARDNGHNA